MRCDLPKRCDEHAVAAGQDSLLEEVGSKARVRSGLVAQEDEGKLD